jgi:CheY-like chemotaxis protein
VSRKLLLADDNPTIRRVIELTFAGEDVQVVTVEDGEQAIQRIPFERPDIVLADIGMRKRSGYEVAAFVKNHPELSHVPVLLLAGAFEPVDEARAKQVRAAGVLVKPFEPDDLVARVRGLVGSARPADPVAPRGITTSASSFGEPHALRGRAEQAHAVPADSAPAVSEPTLPKPQLGNGRSDPSTGSLDDYFDRLDAAFATLGASHTTPSPPAPPLAADEIFAGDVPTIEDVIGEAVLRSQSDVPTLGRVAPPPAEPADASSTLTPSPRVRPVSPAGRGNALADLFGVLLAVEKGDADPGSIRIAPTHRPTEITDELVDRVTRRVLERLAPDTVRDVVEDIVSAVAERLVREEIERIRKT